MNGTEHRTQKRTHTYVSIFLLTNGQKEHNGREIAFSTNDAGAAGAMDMKINKWKYKPLNISLTLYTKINSEWIPDLDVNYDYKFLRKKIRQNHQNLG